jgi:hypothetical protein
MIDGGYASNVLVGASSHYCTGRTAVSHAAGTRQPAAAFGAMDSDGGRGLCCFPHLIKGDASILQGMAVPKGSGVKESISAVQQLEKIIDRASVTEPDGGSDGTCSSRHHHTAFIRHREGSGFTT